MESLSKLLISALSAFVRYLPTALLGIAIVAMFGTVYHGQADIRKWQKHHGTHSKLVKEALDATELRLKKTDKAMAQMQDTLYKTTLVISALRAEAATVDKVRAEEFKKLAQRAAILRKKFGLVKTAAEMENRLLRQRLATLKGKIKYYEQLQGVK